MELRLPLVLLCVSTSFSIEDNETEGHPMSILNISSEDYGWAIHLDGRPISVNISSEDYGGTGPIDGFPVLTLSKVNRQMEGLGVPMSGIVSMVQLMPSEILKRLPVVQLMPSEILKRLPGIGVPNGGREMNRTRQNGVHVVYKRLLADLVLLRSWWVTKFVPSVYTVVLLVALPLNVMAIIIFLVKVKVKKPAMVYLLNLATADAIFVSILPFHIVYRFSGNNWLMGEGMCRFVTAAFHGNMHGSVLLMTSISVDRFLALVYPVRSLPWRTVRRAWLVCCCIWTISVASTVPIIIMQQTQHIPAARITTCYDIQYAEVLHRFHVYYFFPFYISLLYFLPLIVTTFCYIGIIRSLSAASIKGAQKRTRAVLLSVVVLCVFVLCFGPTNIILLLHFLHVSKEATNSLYIVYILGVSVSSVSCCLDPLIYYYSSSQWQRHVYNLLGCGREGTPQARQHRVLLHKGQIQGSLSSKKTLTLRFI